MIVQGRKSSTPAAIGHQLGQLTLFASPNHNAPMEKLEIVLIPCLTDNYGVLLHAPGTGETACIDAPEAAPLIAALDARGWKLSSIFVTHHHADHTAGIAALKQHYGCRVIGPESESARISGMDKLVTEKTPLSFGGVNVRVIETPGHTLGHISYHIPDAKIAFTADTLFVLGCGRIFEGDPEMMWNSLHKLAALPDDTTIYCGHEYTLANGRFALTVEPENTALVARMKDIEALRAKGAPTVPTTIALEKATNPFLRASEPAIRARLGMHGKPDWQVFGKLREMKNKA
jgi:hydroxyacylglutathione hydrolase